VCSADDKTRELSKYPQLQQFEQQTSVPKVYVVLGLAALYFFLVFFNIAGEFLVNTAGFVLPAYWSMEAVFTMGKADDTQWLTVSILGMRLRSTSIED
jgi:receptor expression-enhancing protein 5/6